MERKKHRIFLDSNVILSGLFSNAGPPRLILDVLSLGLPVLSGLTGRFNLTEIERNLEKKLPAVLPVYRDELPLLNLEIVPVPSAEDIRPFIGAVDAKDAPVLASAIQGRADHFVTGDKKLLARIHRMGGLGFRATNPADFMEKALADILAGGKTRSREGR